MLFRSPKESKQRKGDPQPGPLRGSLKKLKVPENLETSRLCRRRTSKFFNPSLSTFSSPARTGWGIEVKVKVELRPASKRFALAGSPNPSPNPSLNPVLAGLEKKAGVGLKNLDVRRLRSRLVSKFSGTFNFFKEPQSGPDCGSPFFSLGFFGEAKKSKSPAGASPGMLARGTGLTKARWNQEASK